MRQYFEKGIDKVDIFVNPYAGIKRYNRSNSEGIIKRKSLRGRLSQKEESSKDKSSKDRKKKKERSKSQSRASRALDKAKSKI